MNYLIEVSDSSRVLEKIISFDYDYAMHIVDRRRKQGYTVTVKTITL